MVITLKRIFWHFLSPKTLYSHPLWWFHLDIPLNLQNMSFLFTSNKCPAFLKYALIYFFYFLKYALIYFFYFLLLYRSKPFDNLLVIGHSQSPGFATMMFCNYSRSSFIVPSAQLWILQVYHLMLTPTTP